MEELWEVDLPPSKIWVTQPDTWNFTALSPFMDFHTATHQIMLRMIQRSCYNTMTSMTRFYEEYKAQELPLVDFYQKIYRTTFQSDSLSCIGLAYELRRRLLKELSKRFEVLTDYLFFVTANLYTNETIPECYDEGPPNSTGQLKEHGALAMKITIEATRRGFILFDLGYCIDIPVVVMEDGLSPHTGPFRVRSRCGTRVYDFQYYNSSYVHWIVSKLTEEGRTKVLYHRWYYLGMKLANIKQIEKRNKVYQYHAMIWTSVGGPMTGVLDILGHDDDMVILTLGDDEEGEAMDATGMPLDYFAKGQRDFRIEEALNKMAEQSGTELERVKKVLSDWTKVALDKDFVQELCLINNEMVHLIMSSME